MGYKLKKGIVLLKIFDEHYLYPSRKSGMMIGFLVSLSRNLKEFLVNENCFDVKDLSEQEQKKLQNLIKSGFVEEY